MAEAAKAVSQVTVKVGDKSYDFDFDKVRNDEAMLIEKTVGTTFTKWGDAITEGSISALTALIWLVQRRSNPSLKFQDVRFELGEIDLIPVEGSETEASQSADDANPTDGEEASTDGGSTT